jgi:hypothetical protein
MNSRVIDLTGDSSDIEPARASMPRAQKAVKNGARTRADLSTTPVKISDALEQAIETMDAGDLRAYVKVFCRTNKVLRCGLEQLCIVPGKEVVRYHAILIRKTTKIVRTKAARRRKTRSKVVVIATARRIRN